MLVTSIFSFSHNVFKRLLFQTRKNQGLNRKGLNGGKKKKQSNLDFIQWIYC